MQSKTLLFVKEHERFKECSLSKTHVDKAAFFVHSLIKESVLHNWTPFDFIPRARNWFHKVIEDNYYHRWLGTMLESGLIERDYYRPPGLKKINGSWEKGQKGKCYGYRLNPDLVSDTMTWLKFKDKWSDKNEKQRRRHDPDPLCVYTRDNLRQLRTPIRTNEIPAFVENYVSPEYVRAGLQVNKEILDDLVNWNNRYWKLSDLIQFAHHRNQSVIKDGKRIEIAYLPSYIKAKRRHSIGAYQSAMTDLKKRKVYAMIDATSNRIHSNYTNLAGGREIIKDGKKIKQPGLIEFFSLKDEKLVSFDLVSNQFLLAVELYLQTLQTYVEKYNLCRENSSRKQARSLRRKEKKGIEGEEEQMLITTQVLLCDILGSKDATSLLESAVYEFENLVPTKCTRSKRIILDFHSLIKGLIETYTGKEITRAKAKKIGFELFFSSHDYNTPLKAKLKQGLPLFIRFVDEFKKGMIERYKDTKKRFPEAWKKLLDARSENRNRKGKTTDAKSLGNSSFVVMLQNIESQFTHEILRQSKEAGLKVISKHDSYVTSEADADKLKEIILQTIDPHFTFLAPQLRKETYQASNYLRSNKPG